MTRPRFAWHLYHEDCARAAGQLLRVRQQGLPAFVQAGKINAAAADRSISLATALVAQWAWVIDRRRPALPAWDANRHGHFGAYCFEIADDLDQAVEKQSAIARRSPGDETAAILAELYQALAWWQHPPAGMCRSHLSRIVMDADCGRPTAVERP